MKFILLNIWIIQRYLCKYCCNKFGRFLGDLYDSFSELVLVYFLDCMLFLKQIEIFEENVFRKISLKLGLVNVGERFNLDVIL